jgi:hypothetical protein
MPELAGSDVGRYQVSRRKGEWIRYGSWLHDYRPLEMLTGPRVLLREITGAPPHAIHACYLCETYCHYKTILNVNPNENTKVGMQYICGILNSRLLTFILQRTSNKKNAQAFPRLSVGDLKRLPIPGTPAAILHDGLVSLVSSMLSLHKRLAAEKLPHCRDQIQREIDATDRQIDQLVYQLYGLTDDEIRIVEEATR